MIVHFGHLKNVVKDKKNKRYCKVYTSKVDNILPNVIPYPIANYYITVKFDYGIRGVKTEINNKVLLHVSVSELHISML